VKFHADILPTDADQHLSLEVDNADPDAGDGIVVVHQILQGGNIDDIGQLDRIEIQ